MKRDFLYQFIQNLDEGELRYCREALERNAAMQKNGSLELFCTLAQMQHYDAEQLKKQLSNKRVTRHLAVAKTRLYKFLLEEVKRLHQQRLPATDPRKKMEEAELLMQMTMYAEATEVLKKALAYVEKHEDLYLEVTLRNLLRLAYKQVTDLDLVVERTQNEYRLVTATAKLNKLARYVQINDRMFDYLRRYRATDDAQVKRGVDDLIHQPEMQSIKEADSLSSQILFYSIWHRYYSQKNELSQSIEMNKRTISLMESDPERIAMKPNVYRSELGNVVGKLILEKRLEEAEDYLKRLEQVPTQNRRMEVIHFSDTEIQWQLFYMNQGKLEEVAAREDRVDRGLRRFKKQISENSQLTLLYNLVVTFLLLGESGKAKKKIEQIHSYGKLPVRQDIQGLARIFRLIILSEEEDQTTFPHFLRNSKRYFIEKDRHYPLEKVIYEWVKHHNSTVGSKDRKTSCGILANSMSPFVQQNMIGAEEIQLWAEGKHRGISGADVFRERSG